MKSCELRCCVVESVIIIDGVFLILIEFDLVSDDDLCLV